MKEPKTPAELAVKLRSIADRGIFPVHAEEKIILETAARFIEEMTTDAWHDAFLDPPERGGYYLCNVIYPDNRGGVVEAQHVIMWDSENRWHVGDMIVTHWREKPAGPNWGGIRHG